MLPRGFSVGATRVADRAPFNCRWLGLIHLALPARAHYPLPAPLDRQLPFVLFPLRRADAGFPSAGTFVFYYRQFLRLMDHCRAVLPADRFFEVDYEELTQIPNRSRGG
jgi:hypothetical protein